MPEPAFERIAIVNRGEPAMRLINAVRDINLEYGTRVATIALYTDTDRRSMFVREADERYRLGPSVYTDEAGQRKVGYLDYARLQEALVQTGADAAWVGWGFVAEHAEFADMCQGLGIAFIGPNGETMRKLGDKITSKRIAEQAGVPVVPWSGGPIETVEEAEFVAGRIGYPFMIKATAGGGGRGIRRVRSRDEIPDKLTSARSEAASARLAEVRSDVDARTLGEVADEFDGIHDIDRALRVGSVHRIIDPHELRPYVIGAVERGMQRHLAGGAG